jgi:hypothetical protein
MLVTLPRLRFDCGLTTYAPTTGFFFRLDVTLLTTFLLTPPSIKQDFLSANLFGRSATSRILTPASTASRITWAWGMLASLG